MNKELENRNMKMKNNVEIVGILAKQYSEEDIITSENGTRVLKIGIKTNVRKDDKTGEWINDYVNTSVFNDDIETILDLSDKAYAQKQKIKFVGSLQKERFESENGTYIDENGKKWATKNKFNIDKFELANDKSFAKFDITGCLSKTPELLTGMTDDQKEYKYAFVDLYTSKSHKDETTGEWKNYYKNVGTVVYGESAIKASEMLEGQQINISGILYQDSQKNLSLNVQHLNAGLTKDEYLELKKENNNEMNATYTNSQDPYAAFLENAEQDFGLANKDADNDIF